MKLFTNRCCRSRVLQCRLCPVKCEGEEELVTHFSSCHSGNLPFRCDKCLTQFDRQVGKTNHTCTGSNNTRTVSDCIICHKTFIDLNQLYTHYNEDHLKENEFICRTCNKLFPDSETLKEHLPTHKFEKRFACTFCPKSYSTGQCLNLHLKTHTKALIIKCPLCHKIFFDYDSLTKHMLFHANIAPVGQSFKCCFCAAPFSQKVGLKNHFANNHAMEKCLICKLSLFDIEEDNMETHLFKHSSRISRGKMDKIESIWVNKSKIKKEPVESPNLEERRSRRSKVIEIYQNKGYSAKLLESKKPSLIKEQNVVKNQKSDTKITLIENEHIPCKQKKNVEQEIKSLPNNSFPKSLITTRPKRSVPQGLPEKNKKESAKEKKKVVYKDKRKLKKVVESKPQKVSPDICIMTTRSKTVTPGPSNNDEVPKTFKASTAKYYVKKTIGRTEDELLKNEYALKNKCFLTNKDQESEEIKINKSDKTVKKVSGSICNETPRSSKRTPKPVRFEHYECSWSGSRSVQNVIADDEIKQEDVEDKLQLSAEQYKMNTNHSSVKIETSELKQSCNKTNVEEGPRIKQEPGRRSIRVENKKVICQSNELIKAEVISCPSETGFETKERPMSFIFVSTNARASIRNNFQSHLATKFFEKPCYGTSEKSMFSEMKVKNTEPPKEEQLTGNLNIPNRKEQILENENVRTHTLPNRLDGPEYIVPEILDTEQSSQNNQTCFNTPGELKTTGIECENYLGPIDKACSKDELKNIENHFETASKRQQIEEETTASLKHYFGININHHTQDEAKEDKPESVEQENYLEEKNIKLCVIDKAMKPENIAFENNLENKIRTSKSGNNEDDQQENHLEGESQAKDKNKATAPENSVLGTDLEENSGQAGSNQEENEATHSKDGSGQEEMIELCENYEAHLKHSSDNEDNREKTITEEKTKNNCVVKISSGMIDGKKKASTGSVNGESSTAKYEEDSNDLFQDEIIKLLQEELRKQENKNCLLDANEKSNIRDPTTNEANVENEETPRDMQKIEEAQNKKTEKRRGKKSKFIKEKKYFAPTISLTPFSCTTCIESFSSEAELMQHNVLHIF